MLNLLIVVLTYWSHAGSLHATPQVDRGQPDYSLADSVAKSVSLEAARSIPSLAAALTARATNDAERARSIFTWIAENLSYDQDNIVTGKWEQRPEFVILLKSTDCGGQSRLFEALARAAGLEAMVIYGHVKKAEPSETHGLRYATLAENGAVYEEHAWNAVKIAGKWRLLDVTYANGRSKRGGTLTVNHATDYDYFLTPPEQLIYSHFPRDLKWQLLEAPFDRPAHENLPTVRPEFFSSRFTLVNGIKFMDSADYAYTIRMKAPKEMAVTAELRQNGRKLEGAFTFPQQSADGPEIRLVFPAAGVYVARLFARSSTLKKEPYQWIMDMRIESKAAQPPGFQFPERFSMFEQAGCYISEPLNGVLGAGKPQLFHITVPGAFEAAIKTGGKFFPLAQQGDSFSGSAPIESGEVRITARFPTHPNLRHTLLAYTAK